MNIYCYQDLLGSQHPPHPAHWYESERSWFPTGQRSQGFLHRQNQQCGRQQYVASQDSNEGRYETTFMSYMFMSISECRNWFMRDLLPSHNHHLARVDNAIWARNSYWLALPWELCYSHTSFCNVWLHHMESVPVDLTTYGRGPLNRLWLFSYFKSVRYRRTVFAPISSVKRRTIFF